MSISIYKRSFFVLLIALLFVKALIPLGFMPSLSGDKNIQAITICSGQNEIQIFVDDAGRKVPAPTEGSQHPSSSCEFSLASIFIQDEPAHFLTTDFLISDNKFVAIKEFPSLSILKHAFQAQGPPTIV